MDGIWMLITWKESSEDWRRVGSSCCVNPCTKPSLVYKLKGGTDAGSVREKVVSSILGLLNSNNILPSINA